MKLRDLSTWFFSTAWLLGLRLDDKDRRSPTYPGDGRICIARLKQPAHVVHEFAHFVDAIPSRRRAPNYGLGQDPDRGPVTSYSDMLDLGSADLCEVMASFLTFPLLVEADLGWRHSAKRMGWCDPTSEMQEQTQRERIELCIFHFKARGIDVFDPLAHFRAGDPDR